VYGPWWGACLVDFPRFLGVQLRDALESFAAVDMPDIIRQLIATRGSAMRREILGDYAEWGAHEENTARLLDVREYELELAWADRTFDPDDRETRRERLEAKRRGIKPPPHPLVPPVAHRPAQLAEAILSRYLETVKQQQVEKERGPIRRTVSMTRFNEINGLTAERG
jgi:hypothetical protein